MAISVVKNPTARKLPPVALDAAASGLGSHDKTIQDNETRRLKEIFLEKTDRIDKMPMTLTTI